MLIDIVYVIVVKSQELFPETTSSASTIINSFSTLVRFILVRFPGNVLMNNDMPMFSQISNSMQINWQV